MARYKPQERHSLLLPVVLSEQLIPGSFAFALEYLVDHELDLSAIFYVIEGTMSFLVGAEWIDAPKGAFVLVPGETTHDFENRSEGRAGVLNFSVPGEFEPHMPGIAEWFAKNPPGDAGG